MESVDPHRNDDHREAWEALPENVKLVLDHLRPKQAGLCFVAPPSHPTAIERAFELAWSRRFRRLDELERALCREGYSAKQLEGPLLRRQLRAAMGPALDGSRRLNHRPNNADRLDNNVRPEDRS